MSKLSPRWPVNARVLPSGDQPCQYEGAFGVICAVYRPQWEDDIDDRFCRLDGVADGEIVPSGEMP